MSSTKFVFFRPIGKTRWPPWPLIGWDIFDFFTETAERNSTKHDRKQDLNILYQVCVFRADRKNKMAALASDWLRHFRLLLWNRWTEFNETWQEARSQRPLPSLCFLGRSEKTRWPLWPLIGWDIFDFFTETAERNSTKHDRKQDLNVLYQVCVFRADRKNKMAALASDWLRHFNLLLWNRWTKFNETWQEARSQRVLPWLCFSSRWINKNCCPGRSGIQKGGTLYSGARYVALWASCYTPVFRWDVLWCDVRPSWSPSISHSFSHFSPTCFDILSWNFALHFPLMNIGSSLSVANFRHF